MSVDWTSDQRRAIETTGVELAVSAAAGSGKTATLAERYVHLLSTGCSVGDLLVVTFTNAAADEMRGRIAGRLTESVESQIDESLRDHLAHELERLSGGFIGTIDGFCGNLVRRNDQAAGVDPAFATLDAEQAAVLRRQAAGETIDIALGEDEAVAELADDLFDGNLRAMAQTIVSLHETLAALPDPADRKTRALRDVEEAAESGDLFTTTLGRAFLEAVRESTPDLPMMARRVRWACDAGRSEPKLARLIAFAEGWSDVADAVAAALDAGDLAAASAAVVTPTGTLALGKKGPEKEAIKQALEPLREAITKSDLAAVLSVGDAWQSGLASTVQPTRTLLALLDSFADRYAAEKRRLRSLDFADVSHLALDLLRDETGKATAVARELRQRYAHVLVDESQDLNALQDALLSLISRPADAGNANLFSVGDVKQSVYGFRHAEPRRFLDRLHAADATEGRLRINLQSNFRSRPPLLSAINVAMSRLMTSERDVGIDYADGHALRPGGTHDAPPAQGFAGSPIDVLVLDGAPDEEADDQTLELEQVEREAVAIAKQLHAWQDEGRQVVVDGVVVALDWRHVAVLMRSPRFGSRRFTAAMRRSGVPCTSEVGTGFFSTTEVLDVVSVLRLLDNRRRDVELAAYLRSPIAGLTDGADVLGRCRVAGPEARHFADAVDAYAATDPAVQQALGQLDEWAAYGQSRPVADTVWRVLTHSGYLAYVTGLRDGSQRHANLIDLHERAIAFDAGRRGAGVGDFVSYLAAIDEAGEVGQATSGEAADNVVRLMSIHAAKGLEFPIVFVAGCGKAHNMRSVQAKVRVHADVALAVPAVDRAKQVRFESPQSFIAGRLLTKAALAEELRLLYVAMTRAREHLVCIGHARSAVKLLEVAEAYAAVDRLDGSDVLKGRSFLEWLVWAAAGRAEHLAIRVEAAVDHDVIVDASDREAVPLSVKRLEAVEAEGDVDDETASTVRRLAASYRFVEATRREAAVDLSPRVASTNEQIVLDWVRKLIVAAETGEALDIDDKDREAADWLAATEPLRALEQGARALVDVPLLLAGDGETWDRPMVRGRAGLLIETNDVKRPLVMVDVVWAEPSATVGRAAALAMACAAGTGRAVEAWLIRVQDRHCQRVVLDAATVEGG